MADEALVQSFAEAIASAEGFSVPNSRPNRNNNPGNLTLDIEGGSRAIGRDGPFMVYATAEDGWEDLRQQVRMMFDNLSRIYNSNMSIREVAERYTTTEQQAWAENVAAYLGVSLDTRLNELGGAVVAAAGGAGILLVVVAALWLFGKRR